MTIFSRLQQQFFQGRIARDDYWRAASGVHQQLADYSKTLSESDVQAIHITAEGLNLVLKSGVRLLWDPNDIRSSANTLVNHGNHEDDDARFLLAAAKGAECIFDIGANAGYYALHFAKQFAPIKKVHAFEPVPHTYQTLTQNIAINKLGPSIVANNLALGQKNGKVKFFIPAFSGSCAASMKKLHPGEDNIEVSTAMTTLDEYCDSHQVTQIDLMKIDVEGAEFFVLQGGIKTLERCKPTLFIEILRKWSRQFGIEPNQTIRFLLELGYQCWAVEAGQLVSFESMTEDTPQTNFFFTHPSRVPDPISAWRKTG